MSCPPGFDGSPANRGRIGSILFVAVSRGFLAAAALIEDGTSSRRSVRHTRPFMAMFAASGRTREGSCYSSEARRSGGPSTGGSSTGRTLRRAGSRSGQASDRRSPAVGFDAPYIHSLRRACREPPPLRHTRRRGSCHGLDACRRNSERKALEMARRRINSAVRSGAAALGRMRWS
jgi:hypothetical protein